MRTGGMLRSRSTLPAAAAPCGKSPLSRCHLSAWPISASSREGGASTTSAMRSSASAARRPSRVEPSGYASRASKKGLDASSSRRLYASGSCACSHTSGSALRSTWRAALLSRRSASSRTSCSYNASSLSRGSASVATTCSTASHRPSRTSRANASTDSTALRDTCASSCSAAYVDVRPFSCKNWRSTRTMSAPSTPIASIAPPSASPRAGWPRGRGTTDRATESARDCGAAPL
mmetsp:Transcript_6660/g.21021  ORF Transcript_6660/g.21021 Transcript_6660/m.21021 type:complete len:234 (+) Transcript_6660:1123-1824(+)